MDDKALAGAWHGVALPAGPPSRSFYLMKLIVHRPAGRLLLHRRRTSASVEVHARWGGSLGGARSVEFAIDNVLGVVDSQIVVRGACGFEFAERCRGRVAVLCRRCRSGGMPFGIAPGGRADQPVHLAVGALALGSGFIAGVEGHRASVGRTADGARRAEGRDGPGRVRPRQRESPLGEGIPARSCTPDYRRVNRPHRMR